MNYKFGNKIVVNVDNANDSIPLIFYDERECKLPCTLRFIQHQLY